MLVCLEDLMDDKQVPGYEHGNFIGPTILTDVTADMECYKVWLYSLCNFLLCVSRFGNFIFRSGKWMNWTLNLA